MERWDKRMLMALTVSYPRVSLVEGSAATICALSEECYCRL